MEMQSAAPPEPVATYEPVAGAVCNICGGATFRAVASLPDRIGFSAVCSGCGSPARHRALRVVVDALRGPEWKNGRGLRFSRDRVVANGWFAEMGEQGGACDALFAIDVLETVPDLAGTLRTWLGWLRPGGLMLLAMRNVPGRATTLDWGFPRGDRDGEYRVFGLDIGKALPGMLPGAAVVGVRTTDPVTTAPAVAFVVAHALADLQRLRDSGLQLRVLAEPSA